MISANGKSKTEKKELPLFRMADMCVGPMTGPSGSTVEVNSGHIDHGTAHVHIKTIAPWEKRG